MYGTIEQIIIIIVTAIVATITIALTTKRDSLTNIMRILQMILSTKRRGSLTIMHIVKTLQMIIIEEIDLPHRERRKLNLNPNRYIVYCPVSEIDRRTLE